MTIIGTVLVHSSLRINLYYSALRFFVVLFCRAMFFVGGFHRISVKGRAASADEAPILATAPHSSYFDVLAIVYFQLTTVVAKSSAARVLLFGSMFVVLI